LLKKHWTQRGTEEPRRRGVAEGGCPAPGSTGSLLIRGTTVGEGTIPLGRSPIPFKDSAESSGRPGIPSAFLRVLCG